MANMSFDQLESEAMKLDAKARARLAGKLLESLEGLSDEESERLWIEEARRRQSESESGDRDAEDVFGDIRDKLR